MPMRKCKDVMEEIDRIADGEASRTERMRFSMHLAMCENCDRYYRQYLAVRSALGEVDKGELPVDFEEVMARVLKTADIATADIVTADTEEAA